MKSFLTLIIFLSLLSSAKAATLIDKVQEVYRATDNFHADFTQKTHIAALDRHIEEKGELIFARPGKFSIHYEGERERLYLSEGKTLWIYRPHEREVEVYENLNDMISREALAFLGGLGEMTKEFKVTQDTENQLKLEPKRRGSPLKEIYLTIDPQTNLVKAILLLPKSGNQSHYRLTNVRTNEKIPENTFQFQEQGVKATHPMEL